MTELNAQQKYLFSYIDEYRNLVKGVAERIKDYIYAWKATPKEELPHFSSWPEPISEIESNRIVFFLSALTCSNAPRNLIATVKKANNVLFELTERSGFEKHLNNATLSKKKISDLLYAYDLLNAFIPRENLKNVQGGKAKNKTDADLKKEGLTMIQNETPKTISAPDWHNPPTTAELEKAQKDYGVLVNEPGELARLVEDAGTVFRNCLSTGKGLPESNENEQIKIKSKEFRQTTYYLDDPKENYYINYDGSIIRGKPIPFMQHTNELLQSADTCKPVMRALWSAVKMKAVLERSSSKGEAKKLYDDLETAMHFLKVPNEFSFLSGNDTLTGRHEGQEWLYAGKKDTGRIIEALRQWQAEINERPQNADETNTGRKSKTNEPLTDNQNVVLKILKDLPETKGLKGKEILHELEKEGIIVDQSTLTKSIIPVLKKFHGVKNKGGAGYYIAEKDAANTPH